MDSAGARGCIDEGRSNTDLARHSNKNDSDSDSKSKSWVKSQFWYELPMSDDIPDYREVPYPWEEKSEGKEVKEKLGPGKEEEENSWIGAIHITWSDLSAGETDMPYCRLEEEKALEEGEEDPFDAQANNVFGPLVQDCCSDLSVKLFKGLQTWMQIEEGTFFLNVTDLSWSGLSAEERKRGRWGYQGMELMDIMQSDSSYEQRNGLLLEAAQRMVTNESAAAASLSQVGDLDADGDLDTQHQSVCTTEVLDVRMEMHQCFEQGKSYRHLFKSVTNMDELSLQNASDERSYPNLFPDLHGMDPIISPHWVRPTTFEGDVQYLQFFPQLVRATEYGETEDHVLAKAIVIARKSFQKMLRFQIDIAVKDCMDFLRIDEAMRRRYDLYYFAVREIVLNGKDFESVVKSIRNGDSGLPYSLTEFSSSTYICNAKIREIVFYLVEHFRSERNCGNYEWSCEDADAQVAQIVCDTVDAQIPSPCHLYQQFLWKKIIAAQELGLAEVEDINFDRLQEGVPMKKTAI